MGLIYKLITGDLWQEVNRTGVLIGMPVDLSDGYIHFSTAVQLRETARKHFTGQTGLILLTVDAAPLGRDLKWEPSRGGDLFPHLYAALSMTHVIEAIPLATTAEGAQILPENIP